MRYNLRLLPLVILVQGMVTHWLLRPAMVRHADVRFETMVDQMPMAVLFAVGWLIVVGVVMWDWNKAFTPSRATIRLGALDVDLRTVFFAKAFAGWISLVLLQLTQTGTIVWAYRSIYLAPRATPVVTPVRQGLYLAFMRSDLLQFLFPFRMSQLLWMLGASWLLILAGMGLVSVFRREHSRWLYSPWLKGALLLVAVVLAVVMSYRSGDAGGWLWMLVPGFLAVGLLGMQFRWLRRRELE